MKIAKLASVLLVETSFNHAAADKKGLSFRMQGLSRRMVQFSPPQSPYCTPANLYLDNRFAVSKISCSIGYQQSATKNKF